MAEVKSFTFAVEELSDADIAGQFEINGEAFSVRKLKDSALPVLMHQVRSNQPNIVLASVLNFAELALTPESAKRFQDKYLNPVTGLKMGQVVEVFTEIMAVVARGSDTNEDAPVKRPVRKR